MTLFDTVTHRSTSDSLTVECVYVCVVSVLTLLFFLSSPGVGVAFDFGVQQKQEENNDESESTATAHKYTFEKHKISSLLCLTPALNRHHIISHFTTLSTA